MIGISRPVLKCRIERPNAGEMTSLSDEQLIRALAENDEDALRILVERYASSIYRFSVRYTGDESIAEDVAQEVFLRLFLHAKRFTPGRSFKTWLFAIVRNIAIDMARPYSHRKSFSIQTPEDFSPESVVSGSPTPEDRMASRERQEMIIGLLQDLPEKQRTVVILKYYEDMSTKEIGQVLGKSVSSVESLLARAKQNLAKLLKL